MEKKQEKFIQVNSPDGGFLQSEHWRKFQNSVGRKVFFVEEKNEEGELAGSASIITHTLPIAGDYFYVPRGPVFTRNAKRETRNEEKETNNFLINLLKLAKENNVSWVRVEPASEEILDFIKNNLPDGLIIEKSSVDVQPREILVMDISRSEEEILVGMKQKTRYNIRLSQKKGIVVFTSRDPKYVDEFLRLVKITAKRDGITPHQESYYRKMFEIIPPEILKLYVAEYEGKVIAANLVLFFGKTATYMHGASDNLHRDAMAPYLLQWRQILDAKKEGCEKYDLGGVRTEPHPDPLLAKERGTSWRGITKFKTGFAPETKSVKFPGCYDIILKPARYRAYRLLQKIKRIF